MSLTRRDVIKLGALGSAALLLPVERGARAQLQFAARLDPALLPAVGQLPFKTPPDLVPRTGTVTVPGSWIHPSHPAGEALVQTPVDYYDIRMQQRAVPIIPGQPATVIWGYQGITPGPTLHAERWGDAEGLGRPVIVRFYNDMTAQHPVLLYRPDSSVHLHGNASLPQHDGYANDLTEPGRYKDYWYPTIEDARTLWYHDHAVHHTASNTWMGLAGQYQLHDDIEQASGLPVTRWGPNGQRRLPRDQYQNPYDVPLILRDALFDTSGQLIFRDNDESGSYGDVIMVNGVPWPTMRVEPRQYRFRILNAASSRSFDLALTVKGSTARLPLLAVATDAGIMKQARASLRLRMAPAERYEVVIDFAGLAGRTLRLHNLRPENNIDFPTVGAVMEFQVGTTVTNTTKNATRDGKSLRDTAAEVMSLTPNASTPRRSFVFNRDNSHWTINGQTWEDVINSNFEAALATPSVSDVEVWTLRNLSGGWFHPIHVHLIDFKILSRTLGKNPGIEPYERGAKDVVYLGESDTIEIIAHFGPQIGKYMMHCHNTVHEDHDMMHQFRVRPGSGSPGRPEYDPLSARAASQPANGALQLAPNGPVQFPPPAA